MAAPATTALPSPAPAVLPPGAIPTLTAAGTVWALWTLPEGLATDARLALAVTALAVIGWVFTRLPEALVALAAATALVLSGVVPETRLYAMLGNEAVWLLLAAFLIAAVLKDSGLVLRLVSPVLRGRPRVAGLVALLTAAIALTALVLPSTSGRAALLLPLCVALASVLPDPRLVRGITILFPTVILLSAGGSLVGAGAHLVAVEAIAATTGLRIDYLGWLILGGPLALAASALGALLVVVLFVPRKLWTSRVDPLPSPGPMTVEQGRIGIILALLVALWVTGPVHGVGMAMVAILGALVLLTPAFGKRKTKDVFRAVDVELILFMASAALMAQALIETGADAWLAGLALAAIPPPLAAHATVIAVALAAISVAAHLVITSRSARAAVLIPAVALPAAGLGHDPGLMVLIVVMGTGFCQTMMASAKPVAIFAAADGAFTQRDLLRLALPLAPAIAALVAACAIWIWPSQLAAMRNAPQAAAVGPVVLHPAAARTAPADAATARPTATATVPADRLTAVAPDRLAGIDGWLSSPAAAPTERPKARPEATRATEPAAAPRAERRATKPGPKVLAGFRRDLRVATRGLRKLFR